MKTITIRDYYGDYKQIPVDDALYDEWVQMNNETQRIQHKEMYHRSNISLEQIEQTMGIDFIEEWMIAADKEKRNRQLYEAISKLTPVQQRRVLKYMESNNYAAVARSEGIAFGPLYRSMQLAFKKLRILVSDIDSMELH